MVRFGLGLSFTPLGAFQCHGRRPWGVGRGLGGLGGRLGGGEVSKWWVRFTKIADIFFSL